jgi:cysteine desulfuration protein SufE
VGLARPTAALRGGKLSHPQSPTIDEILDDFEELGDWEARCDYLIDLGFDLPDFPEAEKTEENRVHGCQSNVWMIADVKKNGDSRVEFKAVSDAMIVRGLIAVLLAVYSGRSPREILDTDIAGLFAKLGLDQHLSSARRNGLLGMVKRIRGIAAQANV